jgi:hypothetical protein
MFNTSVKPLEQVLIVFISPYREKKETEKKTNSVAVSASNLNSSSRRHSNRSTFKECSGGPIVLAKIEVGIHP